MGVDKTCTLSSNWMASSSFLGGGLLPKNCKSGPDIPSVVTARSNSSLEKSFYWFKLNSQLLDTSAKHINFSIFLIDIIFYCFSLLFDKILLVILLEVMAALFQINKSLIITLFWTQHFIFWNSENLINSTRHIQ